MKLNVWELGLDNGANNELFFDFVPQKNVDLYAVRLHLMIVGAPSGTLVIALRDSTGNDTLYISDAVTISTLLLVENNAHGMYRFLVDLPLKQDVTYRLALVAGGGYSYSASAFVGWCSHSELRRINLSSDFLGGGLGEPLGTEFWAYDQRQKGVA